ncbi:MAG: ABC-F family ATP-binding cassette domain-containing protein, partial [Ktedonobacterales bacterium]
MLECQHVTLSRGGKTLLADASFLIARGEKVGIVGVNGAGKTTLMQALRGALDPDAGLIVHPKRIGYLGQERLADAQLAAGLDGANDGASATVRDVMLAGRDLARLAAELRAIEAQLAQTPTPVATAAHNGASSGKQQRGKQNHHRPANSLDALLARYGDLEERFSHLGGYAAEHEIAELLTGLALDDVELDRPVAALSGGQKTRLALARTLFATHDLLLLDEPTNHLDGAAILWLMDYLARYEGAVVLISHDLELLDRAITRILHLDATTRTLTAYSGNYTSYVRQRDMNEQRALAETERQQETITRLQEQADWMRGKTDKMARRAKVLDHRIERIREELPDVASLPRRERAMTMRLPIRRQSGRIVFTVDRLSKSYGGPLVLNDLSFEVERGKRLVVIGRNGAGKTTLLRLLAGVLPPTHGRITAGQMVDLGYYAQEHELLHPHLNLLEEMRLASDEAIEEQLLEQPDRKIQPPSDGELRALLGRFLLSGDQGFQRVASLSGGEKTRLALARLMLGGYNTLLLDEPTNNL